MKIPKTNEESYPVIRVTYGYTSRGPSVVLEALSCLYDDIIIIEQ